MSAVAPIPVWSILVCAVARRVESHTAPLLARLCQLTKGHPVEVLALFDNYYRTTGEKRNQLLNLAKGEYVSFVDDDDDVADTYVTDVLEPIRTAGPDLITFAMKITHDNGMREVRTETRRHDIRVALLPMHTQIWRRTIAMQAQFPPLNFGEDQPWIEAVAPHVKAQVVLDKELYHYRWKAAVSESRHAVLGSWLREAPL